jgi:hypothetical protein
MSEPTVTITLPLSKARQIDYEMSDLLCWTAGFAAARPDDATHDPMGTNGTRRMRELLNDAIIKTEKSPL